MDEQSSPTPRADSGGESGAGGAAAGAAPVGAESRAGPGHDDDTGGTTAADAREEAPVEPGAGTGAGTPTAGPPPSAQLFRDTEDRMVAGVCGGLGRHFGIDPVLPRILVAVLTLFSGFGVLLYGLAWLLVPQCGTTRPLVRELMSGRLGPRAIAAAVTAALGATVFVTYVNSGFGPAVPLLAVSAVVLFLSWADTRRTVAASPVIETAPHGASTTGGGDGSRSTAAPVSGPTGDSGETALLPPGPPPWWRLPRGETDGRDGHDTDKRAGGDLPPADVEQPDRHSHVGALTVSLAAFAAGVMWALDALHVVRVLPVVGAAVVLLVLAAGLLAGAFLGRARWLVLPATAVTLLLAALAWLNVPFIGATGQHTWRPATVSALESPYRMRLGQLTVDLRSLDGALGPQTPTASVRASVAVGALRVRVPDDVRLVVHAHSQAGQVRLPDGTVDGLDAGSNTVVPPLVVPARGTITLDLRVGVGEVEVTRDSS